METKPVINKLNELLQEEFAAVVRYLHHSFLIFGPGRIPVVGLLRKRANDAMSHAIVVGEKISALGGHPTVRISEVLEPGKQSIEEMLREDLASEKKVIAKYKEYLPRVKDDVALHFLLCRIIEEEQIHVEDLEKLLRRE